MCQIYCNVAIFSVCIYICLSSHDWSSGRDSSRKHHRGRRSAIYLRPYCTNSPPHHQQGPAAEQWTTPSNLLTEEVEKHEWCSLNSYLAELMWWELRWPVSFQTAFLKANKPKRYTIVTWSEVTWMRGRRLNIAWSDLEVPRVRSTLLCRVYSFAVSCTNARDKKLKFLCQIVFVTLQPVCINAGCYVLLSATRIPPTGAKVPHGRFPVAVCLLVTASVTSVRTAG